MFGPEATRLDGAPGFPIRRPAGQRACAPHRGLSQLAASFVGFLCQGIRRLPLPSSFYLRRYGFTTRWAPSAGPWVSYCMRCDLLEENLRWSRYAALKVRPGRAPGTGHRAGAGPRAARGRQGTRGMAPRPDGTARRHNRFSRRDLSLPRKEVIQPHLPVRLPCYDFTPLTSHTFGTSLPCGLGRRLRVQATRVV